MRGVASEGGDDVLVVWRKRLPITSMFVGESKGRSVKPLREKISRLGSRDDTAADAQRLKLYLANLLFAHTMRHESILKLPDSELQAAVASLVREGVKFPASVQLDLVEHRINELHRRFELVALAEACKPWAASHSDAPPFDPQRPLLALVPMPVQARISKSRSWLWGKVIAPLLMAGQDASRRIMEISDCIIKCYADEDELELDSSCAIHMGECMEAAQCMKCIVELIVEPPMVQTALKVMSRKGKTDRGILTVVANAIMTCPWMEKRATLLDQAQPVIAEFGQKMAEMPKELEKMQNGCDAAHFHRLAEMCKDIGKVRASGYAELWEDCSELLQKSLLATWALTCEGMATGTVHKSTILLDAVQSCVSEASLAFSMEGDITKLAMEVGEVVAAQGAEVKERELIDLLTGPRSWNWAANDMAALLQELIDAAAACKGHQMSPRACEVIDSTIAGMGNACAAVVDIAPADAIQKGFDLWQALLEVHSSQVAPKAVLLAARAVFHAKVAVRAVAFDGEVNFVEMRPKMHELEVRLKTMRHAMKKLEDSPESTLMSKLEAEAESTDSAGTQRLVTLASRDLEERTVALVATAKTAAELCFNMHVGARWHHEVPDDWQAFAKAAEVSLKRLDTRELEGVLSSMKERIDQCHESAMILKDRLDSEDIAFDRQEFDTTWAKMKGVLHEALLQHALVNETDQQRLRKSAQLAIKSLRAVGLKEQDFWHPAQVKRAWAGIRCIGQQG